MHFFFSVQLITIITIFWLPNPILLAPGTILIKTNNTPSNENDKFKTSYDSSNFFFKLFHLIKAKTAKLCIKLGCIVRLKSLCHLLAETFVKNSFRWFVAPYNEQGS